MSNSYYNHGSYPTTGAPGTSASMRSELDSITSGFNLLPTISGNGSKAVVVNSGATALTVTTGTLALAGNFATTGAYNTTLIQGATTSLTLPLVSGTLATLAGTEEFTNKTLTSSVGKGTWTTSGTWTLPALTLGGAITYGGVTLSNAVTGTGNMVLSASPTLTGTIAAASQTLSGTLGVTGVATFTAQPIMSSLTASKPVFTDASKGLTSTGTLAYDQGGTGQTSYAAGDIVYASGVNTLAKLTIGTTGQRLVVAAGLPSWATDATIGTVTSVGWTGGIVSVATATTTPAFTIAGTSGGIPYFASGTTWATSAALAANALVLGGGAGAAPATTTTGTGVVTALGIAPGSTGGMVLTGGAFSGTSVTASSLTSGRVTYAGTAGLLQDSANLTFNGTTLTANTIGAFTLSGTVAGGGNQLNNVIIGTTTPLAGAFTTLSASGATNLATGGVTVSTQLGTLTAPANVGQLQQVFNGAAAWGGQSTVGGETDFGWNFYYYGGFKSRLADVASRLSFNATSGRVSFWTAPNPGSADAALTFTEALRIDATTGVTALGAMAVGNNLAVTGTLSATQNVSFQKAGANTFLVENTASTANVILNLKQTTGTAALGINSSAVYFDDTAARPYVFYTNGTERARVDTTGLAVTGTLTSTGNMTCSAATGQLYFSGASYGQVAATSDLYLDAGASKYVYIRPNNGATAGLFSAAGLAVTGTLSASGDVSANNGLSYITGVISPSSAASGKVMELTVDSDRVDMGGTFRSSIISFDRTNTVYGDLNIQGLSVGIAPSGTIRGLFTSTGLAVTGTLSATGTVTAGKMVLTGGASTTLLSAVITDNDTDLKFGASGSGTTKNTKFYTDGLGTLAMTLDASGNLLMGMAATVGGARMSVQPTAATGVGIETNGSSGYYPMWFQVAGAQKGYITTTTGGTTYNTTSDYRLKENIQPMTGALAKVAQLKPCTYVWKETGDSGQGFIAHELAEVVPECVSGEKDGTYEQSYEVSPAVKDEQGNIVTPAEIGTQTVPFYQGVDTSNLVATLTAAIQEQQAIITALTTRITALENK